MTRLRPVHAAILGLAALLTSSCTGATCVSAICGCWEPFTVEMEITVVDEDQNPREGIAAICLNEGDAIAFSDADGVIAKDYDTRVSPGCGPERCNTITLTDPSGACEGTRSTIAVLNFTTVVLTCAVGDDDDSGR
jgi:hypothetical protein